MFLPGVIWSLCLLSVVARTDAKRKRYFCDTWQEANQASVYGTLENGVQSRAALFARFRRIVGHANEIYFVFNNRTFYTERIEIDELADEELGPTSFLIGDIYVDEEIKDPGPYALTQFKGIVVGGHLYRPNEAWEFYRVNFDNNLFFPDLPLHFDLQDTYFILEFSEGQAKRAEMKRLSYGWPGDFKIGKVPLPKLLVGAEPYKRINYALLIDTDGMNLAVMNVFDIISYGKFGDPYISNQFALLIKCMPKTGRFKGDVLIDVFGGNKVAEEQKRVDQMIYGYLLKVDAQNPENYELFLMELLDDTSTAVPAIRIRLGYFTFRDRKAAEWSVKVTWDQLLSCHTWDAVEMRTEARGIYYDKPSKAFYVFIKRFYLLYTEDLVKSCFHLGVYETADKYLRKERYFGDRAHDIKFDSGVSNVKWDLGPRMYVKNFANRAYLTPGRLNFAITSLRNKLLVFKQSKYEANERILKFCFRQTFELDHYTYCFDEKAYRLIYKPGSAVEPRKIERTLIARIFDGAPFQWGDWPIKFIFNYKENLVVFLSYEFFFVFSYNNFRRRSDDDTLYFENDKSHVPVMSDNCLFIPYRNKQDAHTWPIGPRPTKFPISTTEILTTTPTTKLTTTTTTTTTPKPTTKEITPTPATTTIKTSGPTEKTTESKTTTSKPQTTSTRQSTGESENPTGVTDDSRTSETDDSKSHATTGGGKGVDETGPIINYVPKISIIRRLIEKHWWFLLGGLILLLVNILLCSFYVTAKRRRPNRRPVFYWPRTRRLRNLPFFSKRRPKTKKIKPPASFEPAPKKAPPAPSRKLAKAKEKKIPRKSPPKQTRSESPATTIDSSKKSSGSKSSSDRSKRSDTPQSSSFAIPKKI